MYKTVNWKTGPAAERARHDLKIKKALKDGAYKRWKKLLKQKQQAASIKLQAPSSPAGLNLNTIKRYK